jgi:hypothetical protein
MEEHQHSPDAHELGLASVFIVLVVFGVVVSVFNSSDEVTDYFTELVFILYQIFEHFEVHLHGFIVNSHVDVLIPPFGSHACHSLRLFRTLLKFFFGLVYHLYVCEGGHL